MQRGLSGRALGVVPLTPARAAGLPWTAQHAQVALGFEALARATRKPVVPTALQDDAVDAALASDLLTPATAGVVREARDALGQLPVAVLRHTDTSPQNILLDGTSLSGLVDWEDATAGMPGADVWNFALACVDKGVGLARWSEPRLDGSFAGAWFASPVGRTAREAGRRCAEVAGVPADLLRPLEVVFSPVASATGCAVRRPSPPPPPCPPGRSSGCARRRRTARPRARSISA